VLSFWHRHCLCPRNMYELIASHKVRHPACQCWDFPVGKSNLDLRGYLHRRAKNVSVLISSFRFSASKIEIPGADLADGFVSCWTFSIKWLKAEDSSQLSENKVCSSSSVVTVTEFEFWQFLAGSCFTKESSVASARKLLVCPLLECSSALAFGRMKAQGIVYGSFAR